jgi:hypothetical protein
MVIVDSVAATGLVNGGEIVQPIGAAVLRDRLH